MSTPFAIVAGANSQPGQQISLLLAAEGFNVLAVDRALPEVAAEGIQTRAVDLRELQAVQGLVEGLAGQDEQARLDVLVNASRFHATSTPSDAWQQAIVDYQHVFHGNVLSTLLLSRAATPLIKASGGGHIINVTSHDVLPWEGTPSNLPDEDLFASAMWVINGFTDAWAKTLAADNIKVNAVCPEPATPPEQTAKRVLSIMASGRSGENFPDRAGATADLGPEPAPHQRITG